jgi:amphi-Trp domain-containing protein
MAKKDRDESSAPEDGPRTRRSAQFTADLRTEDAAAYLEALARALRNSRLVVQTASESIDVRVASRVGLDLEAKSSRGGKKSSIDLRLNWTEPAETAKLSISSASAPAANGAAEAAQDDDDDDMETVVSALDKAPTVDAAIAESDDEEPESQGAASSLIGTPGTE